MEKTIITLGPDGAKLSHREETDEERMYRENLKPHTKIPTLNERVGELELISQLILEGVSE